MVEIFVGTLLFIFIAVGIRRLYKFVLSKSISFYLKNREDEIGTEEYITKEKHLNKEVNRIILIIVSCSFLLWYFTRFF
tara:strand:+ start:224 stop:460 length:237 start_codon:yes stop_codon:yes gene_type:complete